MDFFIEMESKVKSDLEGSEMALWAANLQPCISYVQFIREAQWVIFCSGISAKAARSMQLKYSKTGECKHPHKNKAVQLWDKHGEKWWSEYRMHEDNDERIAYLRTLPYMGGKALIYQLAKNLGITGYCKPDVHLLRLADAFGYEHHPQVMCEEISHRTRYTVAYVDTILWFAAMKRWAYK